MSHALAPSFQAYLKSRDALAADGLIRLPSASAGGVVQANGLLLDYLRDFVVDVLDQFADEAALTAFAVDAYRTYIKPIDLPGVPNFVIEPAVDEALERMIPPFVHIAWVRLHGG